MTPTSIEQERGIDSTRAAFEAWAADNVGQFSRAGYYGTGGVWIYRYNNLNKLWQCWCAARAAIPHALGEAAEMADHDARDTARMVATLRGTLVDPLPAAQAKIPPPCIHRIGIHACTNRLQCFEPCGELGHSAEHAKQAPKEIQDAVNLAVGKGAPVDERAAEILSLHRQLAAEKLRADQGWQRYESANRSRQVTENQLAALQRPGQADKLLTIIAYAYQIAGAHDAPTHILDVLADPEAATIEQVDAMLPYQPGLVQAAPDKFAGINQHHVADAFWESWKQNGVPHKHGYYESTWIALRAAIRAATAPGESGQ